MKWFKKIKFLVGNAIVIETFAISDWKIHSSCIEYLYHISYTGNYRYWGSLEPFAFMSTRHYSGFNASLIVHRFTSYLPNLFLGFHVWCIVFDKNHSNSWWTYWCIDCVHFHSCNKIIDSNGIKYTTEQKHTHTQRSINNITPTQSIKSHSHLKNFLYLWTMSWTSLILFERYVFHITAMVIS